LSVVAMQVPVDPLHRVRGLGLQGLLSGLLVAAALLAPGEVVTGYGVLAASVLLVMAGTFLGPLPAMLALAVAVGAWLIGGSGSAWDLAPVALAGGVGALLHREWRDRLARLALPDLAAVGLGTGLALAVWAILRAGPDAMDDWVAMATRALVLVPLAVVGSGALLIDGARRREMDRERDRAVERLEVALTSSGHGVFEFDLEHDTGSVSPAHARLLGEDPATYRPTIGAWLERLHPDDRERTMAALAAPPDGTEELLAEYRMRTRAGGYVWLRSAARVLSRGPGGRPGRVIGTTLDISADRVVAERARRIAEENQRLLDEAVAGRRALLSMVEDLRLAQEGLHESLDRYTALVRESPVPVMVNQGGRMVLVNRAFVRLIGAESEAELLGRSPLDIFAPPDHPEVLRRTREARELGRTSMQRRFRLLRRDGTDVLAEVMGVPFKDLGELSIHVVFRDITEQQRAEEALVALNAELEQRVGERTRDLEEAYRELESFSYSVSHDLRAPLRAITGFSQLLGRRNREQLDEAGRHYLDNITVAGERMGSLIEDLLAYSRVGRREVRREPIDVGAVVEGVIGALVPRIVETGADVMLEAPLATPLGDPTLMAQVLQNLVSNAIVYGRAGVPPRVVVRSVCVGDAVEVSVEDNGIGIAPEHQERVFEVFARLHTEDEIPGTGIGLAIVRKAARLMDGEITLRSVPGEGTTFCLVLPVADAHAVGPAASGAQAVAP
jgi:PAS domain S-box-containing protein